MTHLFLLFLIASLSILIHIGTAFWTPVTPPRQQQRRRAKSLSTTTKRVSPARQPCYASPRSSSNNYHNVSQPLQTKTTFEAPSSSPPLPRRQGYRFGDLTKGLIADRVNQLTGRDEYEFGDLSRWIDGRIKDRVNQVTGKTNETTYEFGDLTLWAWQQVDNATQNFTGKETYQVGDVSKEVLRRVQAGEYSSEDVWLACRILLSAGLGALTPVASLLPIRTLLNLVNMGLAQEVSGRLLEVLAGFLDRRVKHALTGKADYQLGDFTKERLEAAITRVTGKSTYEVGDITKAVHKLATAASSQEASTTTTTTTKAAPQIKMEESSLKELEAWDSKFLSKKS